MVICGWPNLVNKKILQETSITVGEGGKREDATDSGYKDTRITALAIPDKFNVTMDFDWGGAGSEFQPPIDKDGYTEYDRFKRWYKYVHRRGQRPFWFPSITNDPIDNLQSSDKKKMSLYKITGQLQEQQSGFSSRITMTWEEVYSGVIEVPVKTAIIDDWLCENGKATIKYNISPSEEPLFSDFKLKLDDGTFLTTTTLDGDKNIFEIEFEEVTSSDVEILNVTLLVKDVPNPEKRQIVTKKV